MSGSSRKKRIVIKLGSQVVIDNQIHLATHRLQKIISDISALRESFDVLLVSSGAVGVGQLTLGIAKTEDLVLKQACAAVGQSRLMEFYRKEFEAYRIHVGQILVTAHDISRRQSYLNLRARTEALLFQGVIPIFNENDSSSVAELKTDPVAASFGDNDRLSAILASKLDCDLLFILTDVDGIYDSNPHKNKNAQKILEINNISRFDQINKEGESSYGRGGMASKIEAVKVAWIGGVTTVIGSGLEDHTIAKYMKGDRQHVTEIPPVDTKINSRRHWIGYSSGYQGILTINEGACKALIEKKASLLAIGIIGVQGQFEKRSIVSIQDHNQREIARGICAFSAAELEKIFGKTSDQAKRILNKPCVDEVIHRNDLVILSEEID